MSQKYSRSVSISGSLSTTTFELDTQLVSSTEDSRVGVFGVSSVWVCLGQAVMVSEHVKGLLLTQVVSVVSIPAIPTPRS